MDKRIEELQKKVLQQQIKKLTKDEFECILIELGFDLAYAEDGETKRNTFSGKSCEVDRPTALAHNFLTEPGNCFCSLTKIQADKITLVRDLTMIYLLPNNRQIWKTLFD